MTKSISFAFFTLLFSFIVTIPKAGAFVNPRPGKYEITAIMDMPSRTEARIVVNPLTRSAYIIHVENPEFVAKHLGGNDFFEQVRVKFELIRVASEFGPAVARVISVSVVNIDHLPQYDGAFIVVPRGAE